MENELPFDINSLTPEQKAIVMEQLMQAGGQPQQQQGNFATNLFQRRILQPLQVRLGMRDSPADVLRKQQSVLNQFQMQDLIADQKRRNQAAEYIAGLDAESAKALGLNPAQLALAQANPIEAYDDIVNRAFSRETYSTTPQYGFTKDGARIAYQLGDRGGMNVIDVTPTPDTYTVDTGASIQILSRLDNTVIDTIEKEMTPDQAARALIEKDRKNKEDENRIRTLATNLRKEFNTITKEMRDIGLAYGKIEASTREPSAAGDIALLINYMKMLDPGSVVREGEFATAQNAGGVDARVRARYNQALEGKLLSEEQRADFLASAGRVLVPYRDQFETFKQRYSTLAQSQGVKPSDVVINDPFSGLSVIERNRQWYIDRGLTPPKGMK